MTKPLTSDDLDGISSRFDAGTWTPRDLAALFAEIGRLTEANANLIRNAEVLADELVLGTTPEWSGVPTDALTAFALRVVALDAPESMRARRTVNLPMLIDAARAALDGQTGRAGGPITDAQAYDLMRDHIYYRHKNAAGRDLTDGEAIDFHHHEHHGLGGIRNHPEESAAWTAEDVAQMAADAAGADGGA